MFIDDLSHLESKFEQAEYLQNLLVNHATGGTENNAHYHILRNIFLTEQSTKNILPSWVRTNRNLDQFWQFIKRQYPSYAERREFIWDSFNPLLEHLESSKHSPAEGPISEVFMNYNKDEVQDIWNRALERKATDPKGAITLARTMLESVCKHILDEKEISYKDSEDLSQLYTKTSKCLNLSPAQHTDEIFKQILGGCNSVVLGLSGMRNKVGDAHAQGKKNIRVERRHAELAVNLAGAMSMFLIETLQAKKSDITLPWQHNKCS